MKIALCSIDAAILQYNGTSETSYTLADSVVGKLAQYFDDDGCADFTKEKFAEILFAAIPGKRLLVDLIVEEFFPSMLYKVTCGACGHTFMAGSFLCPACQSNTSMLRVMPYKDVYFTDMWGTEVPQTDVRRVRQDDCALMRVSTKTMVLCWRES